MLKHKPHAAAVDETLAIRCSVMRGRGSHGPGKLAGLAVLTVLVPWSLGSARAAETCYDFARQTVGNTFAVGETVQAEHLRVRIHSYQKAVPVAGDQFVEVKSTTHAGGTAPEMYTYQANLLVDPRQPVTEMRFRVGESRGGPENPIGGHANIIFNGTRHVVTGGLSQLDDREFEDAAGRRVRIQARLSQVGTDPAGHWFNGTMKVRAKSGEIVSFGIGGVPVAIDDVCVTPNAP